jgi:hypothetical protein
LLAFLSLKNTGNPSRKIEHGTRSLPPDKHTCGKACTYCLKTGLEQYRWPPGKIKDQNVDEMKCKYPARDNNSHQKGRNTANWQQK